MVRDVRLEQAELADGEGGQWKLEYYIRIYEGAVALEVYGIKIKRIGPDGSLSEATPGLTHSYKEAKNWLKILAASKVTPLSLHDTIDEFIG